MLEDNLLKSEDPSFGGTQRTIYYAKVSWLDGFPYLKKTPTGPLDNSLLHGHYTMKSAFIAGFKKIETILEKNGFDFEAIGDTLVSSAFKNMLGFSVINNTPEAHAFIDLANRPNGEFIFIIPLPDGRKVVCGDQSFAAIRETIKGGSGKKVEEGNMVEFAFYNKGYLYRYYEGTVPGWEDETSSGDGIVQAQ